MQIPEEQKAWISEELKLLRDAISPPKTMWHQFWGWFFDKTLPLLISVMIAFSGYYFTKLEDRRNDASRAKQAGIEATLKNKIAVSSEVATAITQIRSIFKSIVIKCQYKSKKEMSLPLSEQDQELRNTVRFEAIEAGFRTKFVFQPQVINEIHALAEFDEKVQNICLNSKQLSQDYLDRELKITDLMAKSIEQTQMLLVD